MKFLTVLLLVAVTCSLLAGVVQSDYEIDNTDLKNEAPDLAGRNEETWVMNILINFSYIAFSPGFSCFSFIL